VPPKSQPKKVSQPVPAIKKAKTGAVSKPVVKKHEIADSPVLKWLPVIILVATMVFVLLVRLRLLDVPFERDEGEYAYGGQEILRGVPPFKSIHHVKLPGVYGMYALFISLFGHSYQAMHFGLLVCNLINIFFCYLLGKKISGSMAGATSAFFFAILTLSKSIFGFTANTEHFILLYLLPGLLLLLQACDKLKTGGRRLTTLAFFSGLLMGIAYIMKQQAIYFIGFAGLYYIYRGAVVQAYKKGYFYLNGLLMIVGLGLPLCALCLYFKSAGLFDQFWWWTFIYPRAYVGQITLKWGMKFLGDTMKAVMPEHWLILALTAIGLVLVAIIKKPFRVFVIGMFVISLLAVSNGLYFYNHYFLLATPGCALIIGVGLVSAAEWHKYVKSQLIQRWAVPLVLIGVLVFYAISDKDYYFFDDPDVVCRKVYSANPFPESVRLGEYIEQHSDPKDKIVVFGSEPQIYFYANREAATGFIYTYEMMKNHPYATKFQHQMADEVAAANPKYIVAAHLTGSWFAVQVDKIDNFIFQWSSKYISDNYEPVGMVDINDPINYGSVVVFDKPDKTYKPTSDVNLMVFRRKDTAR
jgi:Dolichyl-phosphate-mannose-protein mannosyltransferase